MVFTLFKRKNKDVSNVERTLEVPKSNSVYNTLIGGLTKMEKEGVDRVILTLYESEPNKNITGKWLDAKEDTNYYPFEILEETEQGMIKDKKHYTVVALVRDNVGDIVKYKDRGVEKYQRTHVIPFLPKLKLESRLNYVTNGGIYTEKDLKCFAENATESGWTSEAIEQRIKESIQEYHKITKRLMEEAGVYDTLQKMEKRPYSTIEQIMFDLRESITSIDKK